MMGKKPKLTFPAKNRNSERFKCTSKLTDLFNPSSLSPTTTMESLSKKMLPMLQEHIGHVVDFERGLNLDLGANPGGAGLRFSRLGGGGSGGWGVLLEGNIAGDGANSTVLRVGCLEGRDGGNGRIASFGRSDEGGRVQGGCGGESLHSFVSLSLTCSVSAANRICKEVGVWWAGGYWISGLAGEREFARRLVDVVDICESSVGDELVDGPIIDDSSIGDKLADGWISTSRQGRSREKNSACNF